MIVFFLMSVIFADTDFIYYDCRSCIQNNGRYCLVLSDFNQGFCCDPRKDSNPNPICKDQQKNIYCATSQTIKHPFLQSFVCPAINSYCPNTYDDINIEHSGNVDESNGRGPTLTREYNWNFPVPTFMAQNYNCKYKISAVRSMVDSNVKKEDRGYIFV